MDADGLIEASTDLANTHIHAFRHDKYAYWPIDRRGPIEASTDLGNGNDCYDSLHYYY